VFGNPGKKQSLHKFLKWLLNQHLIETKEKKKENKGTTGSKNHISM